MSFSILGIGTALPRHAISQSDAAEIANQFCCDDDDQRRLMTELYERSGVKRRHSVLLLRSDGPSCERQQFFRASPECSRGGPSTEERMREYETHAAPLAIDAARAALNDAAVSANAITHLITVSCTGFSAPGIDRALVGALELSPGVTRTHIGFMGCHGALNGLRVARAFAESDPNAVVLLCAVELCSLHHACDWNLERIIANSLFADGAAAVVGRAGPNSATPLWNVVSDGSAIIPNSQEAMSWRISNHGFQMTLSRRVPELIRQNLGRWLGWWLRSCGMTVDQIAAWAIHPGGPRILSVCAEVLDLPDEQLADSRTILEECGNMSSPTILFILDRLRRTRTKRPCVALGFGPGMAIEAALLK